MAEAEDVDQEARAGGVAARLRHAREAAGLTLGDIAARTRIAERHLLAIEEGRFADLASRTYAVGFARAFARHVGLDEQEVAAEVRAEIAGSEEIVRPRPTFEPGDPARVPSRRMAWLAAFGVVVLLGVIYATWRSLLVPAGELPELVPDAPPTAPAADLEPSPEASAAPAPAGPVVFTALAPDIWVKFYDTTGKQLMQKQMARGETYTVPADAVGPRVWTARPDALAITIAGRPVAPLAARQTIVKDVPVSAVALLARGATGAGLPGTAGPPASASPPSPAPPAETRTPSPTAPRPAPTAARRGVSERVPVATIVSPVVEKSPAPPNPRAANGGAQAPR